MHQAGNLQQAEKIYEEILSINPHHAETLHAQAILACQRRQYVAAVALFRQAIQEDCAKPAYHFNLGNAFKDSGLLAEAVPCYGEALRLKPDYCEALNNLGTALQGQDKFTEAVAAYQQALQIKPNYAEALYNLANSLRSLDRLPEAIVCLQQAMQIKENFSEVYNCLGNIFQEQGKSEAAIGCFRHALHIVPTVAEYHFNLAKALKDQGQLDEAIVCYQKVIELMPSSASAYNNLGNALSGCGRMPEAEICLRQALELKPDYAEAHSNLAIIQFAQGRAAEAEACYRRALELLPDYAVAHSNLLFCLTHNTTVDAKTLFAEHCRFGEQFETTFRLENAQHPNSKNPERPLRIGFVSGDLRTHAVAYFIEPVLAYLSGYPQLSLHAYANHAIEDTVTQRLRGHFSHWKNIVGLSDEALATQIRADHIDILIDLSGHSALNRLLIFARKPAPVQASWMGYPGTTGLRAMDYYLADRFLLPPGQLDNQFTEKIVRLPANAPFLPSKHAPQVNTLPALHNGYVTFASFNRPSKLSPAVIALWSQLLGALPTARLLLADIAQDAGREALINSFAQEGIARDRLVCSPRCSMIDYQGLHQQVDICLDTFPYNGGTTTCHALWMGVPTLTLAGATMPGRVGAAVLSQVGLEGFIAHDQSDFVQKGVQWANDLATLAEVRAGLRARFTQSALGQPALIAAALERALRIMWQRWCAGLPAESFEVSRQDLGSPRQEAMT
ncbi:MAG: tetratricopeptide repeat protein [Deltaproteobacteria bacterium]|nr:tetratricopeptide repeat protein [Deltaproteobacteria bacterium]